MAHRYASSPEFSKHSENLREVESGLRQVELLHKRAIREKRDAAIPTLSRLQYLTIGMMAEARLRKIVADPMGFNDRERQLIRQARSQVDQWVSVVDFAFRRQYAVPIHLEMHASGIADTYKAQHALINTLLLEDLAPVVEDRNKIAHAQWAWLLNSKETSFKGAAPGHLNYSALFARSTMIRAIGSLASSLVLSEPTFQRDYDKNVAEINRAKTQIDGSGYEDFVRKMLSKIPPQR